MTAKFQKKINTERASIGESEKYLFKDDHSSDRDTEHNFIEDEYGSEYETYLDESMKRKGEKSIEHYLKTVAI